MKEHNNNMAQGAPTSLRMTAEVWNSLAGLMDADQLENFMENLEYIQDRLVSDPVVTNCIDDFGGADRVLLLLNAFKRMADLFAGIRKALGPKPDDA